MSVPAASSDTLSRAVKVHPLRAISFGNPAVMIDRRDDGTIYLKPKTALGDYPVRLTDRLHHWARFDPNRVFMAERDYRPWLAANNLHAIAGFDPEHRFGAARARALGRRADRHSLRQFDRSRAAGVWRALCGNPVLSGVAGLFAGVKGLRQARLSDEAVDAWPGVRRRRHHIRRRARRPCSRRSRDRCLARRSAGPWRDHARRSVGNSRTIRPSMRRIRRSVRIPSPNSC